MAGLPGGGEVGHSCCPWWGLRKAAKYPNSKSGESRAWEGAKSGVSGQSGEACVACVARAPRDCFVDFQVPTARSNQPVKTILKKQPIPCDYDTVAFANMRVTEVIIDVCTALT